MPTPVGPSKLRKSKMLLAKRAAGSPKITKKDWLTRPCRCKLRAGLKDSRVYFLANVFRSREYSAILASKILDGRKTVELRKRFPEVGTIGATALIYSSSPLECTFLQRKTFSLFWHVQ